MKRETQYQRLVIRRLESEYPGCFILRGMSDQIQGIPDLLILYEDRWVMLEVKTSANEPFQPNQEYYIDHINSLSYCSVIYPENEDKVFYELQQSLGDRRATRLS